MTRQDLPRKSTGRLRVVILSYESHQSCTIIRQLVERGVVDVVGFARSTVVDPRRKGLALVRFLASSKRRTGASWKVAEVLLGRTGDLISAIRRVPRTSLKSLADELSVPCLDCPDAADPGFIERLREQRPDLLVSVHFNQILKPATWAVAPLGAINAHGALLPNHRGLFPHLYAVAAGDERAGVTVHWVDEGLDTGKPISRRSFPINADDTVVRVENRAIPAAVDALTEAIKLIDERGLDAQADVGYEGPSVYHSWPTGADLKRLRRSGHRYLDLRDIREFLFK
jgi:folate-dependent phosphoribosylglycinamide formyltransferase PurN